VQQLDSAFRELSRALDTPDRLNPAASKPLFYFVYPSRDILPVRKRLGQWRAMLEASGHSTSVVSFGRLLWDSIERSGRWPRWVAAEGAFSRGDFNQSVSSVLEAALPGAVHDAVRACDDGRVVLFTDAELLHPWLRTRALEPHITSALRGPGVVFYPGNRTGQFGLEFLGFYDVDGNYRSTIYGVEA